MRILVHRWKVLLSVLLLVSLMCSCAGERVERRPTASPSPASLLPRSFKGYELYSWKSGGTWHFTLITGTNRLKTLAEITSPENIEEGDWIKITAAGVSELKSVLARLPPGTQISWGRARQLDTGTSRSGLKLRLPPRRVVREIQAYCTELGIYLNAGR
jgi:hypothetical protein